MYSSNIIRYVILLWWCLVSWLQEAGIKVADAIVSVGNIVAMTPRSLADGLSQSGLSRSGKLVVLKVWGFQTNTGVQKDSLLILWFLLYFVLLVFCFNSPVNVVETLQRRWVYWLFCHWFAFKVLNNDVNQLGVMVKFRCWREWRVQTNEGNRCRARWISQRSTLWRCVSLMECWCCCWCCCGWWEYAGSFRGVVYYDTRVTGVIAQFYSVVVGDLFQNQREFGHIASSAGLSYYFWWCLTEKNGKGNSSRALWLSWSSLLSCRLILLLLSHETSFGQNLIW